jgi:tRNA(Ile)-lysidine synthase
VIPLPKSLTRDRGRFLVGVSGGRDSVVLLERLVAAGMRKLVVCHLNHGLRGRASGGDASFVRRLAERHDLEHVIEKADVQGFARERKNSLEAAGRRARHEFFDRVGRARRCRRVLLGHHADDQVETVLINLFRGSATLAGMRPVSEIKIGKRLLELHRPMLDIWRDEIDRYALENGVKFREDASNTSPDHLRNRVRHELVPLLRDLFQRDVSKAVARAADIAGAEGALVGGMLDGFPFGETLPVKDLRALDPALQRRAVHRWLRERDVGDIGFAEIERVLSMLSDDSIAKVNLPSAKHARRRAGLLFVE